MREFTWLHSVQIFYNEDKWASLYLLKLIIFWKWISIKFFDQHIFYTLVLIINSNFAVAFLPKLAFCVWWIYDWKSGVIIWLVRYFFEKSWLTIRTIIKRHYMADNILMTFMNVKKRLKLLLLLDIVKMVSIYQIYR